MNRTTFARPMSRWIAVCLLATAWGSTSPLHAETEPKLSHEELFDRDQLIDVKIEIAKADWDQLRMQTRDMASALLKPTPPAPFTYFKGDVTINGHRIESVGIRKKGFIGSLDETRPSLKINIEKYVDQKPIKGLDMLTLNNNKQKGALVSQMLTYKMFADVDLPAPRCNLARVTVNGKLLGVYTHVESVKKEFLERQFGDGSGKLYEGTLADFIVDRIDDLEAKAGDESREEILALANILGAPGELDLDALEKHIDLDEFIRFWALESLTNFWDGYTNNQNNFFAYVNPADSKIHFVPWGADCAFLKIAEYRQFETGPESVHGRAMLANRLYQTDGLADRYRASLESYLDSVWNEQALLDEVDRLEQLVNEHLHDNQGVDELDESRKFIKSRRGDIKRELEAWPQKIKTEPRNPFYTEKVGTAKGTFDTKWLKKEPSNPYDHGAGNLELVLDGETIKFKKFGVYSCMSGFPGPDGTMPPTVVFVGQRESGGKRITLAVSTSEEGFRPSPDGKPVPAQGIVYEGGFLFVMFDFKQLRMAGGTLTLEAAGTEESDSVKGQVELELVRFVGDMN